MLNYGASGFARTNTSNAGFVALNIGGIDYGTDPYYTQYGYYEVSTGHKQKVFTGIASNTTIKLVYKATNAQADFWARFLIVRPIRVG